MVRNRLSDNYFGNQPNFVVDYASTSNFSTFNCFVLIIEVVFRVLRESVESHHVDVTATRLSLSRKVVFPHFTCLSIRLKPFTLVATSCFVGGVVATLLQLLLRKERGSWARITLFRSRERGYNSSWSCEILGDLARKADFSSNFGRNLDAWRGSGVFCGLQLDSQEDLGSRNLDSFGFEVNEAAGLCLAVFHIVV